VIPSGPPNAVLGIIGEFPGENELRMLAPLIGGAGRIARKELNSIGVSLDDCRVTNVWMHNPSEAPGEYEWHLAQAVKAVAGCKVVLLFGSDASQAFLKENVGDVAGLITKSDILPGKIVVVSPNPAALVWGTVGEFRLALEKLSKIKEIKRAYKTK